MKNISEFTLEEMVGQIVMSGFKGADPDDDHPVFDALKNYKLGGLWITDNETAFGEVLGNIESPAQVQKLLMRLKETSEYPLFISIDAEGGRVIRLKEKFGFPPTESARKLGEANNLSKTSEQSESIAEMLKTLGINFNFAPVVDLDINPDNPALGRKERCFSADADTVIEHAREVIKAHREAGILTSLKHFPGQGSASTDSHVGFTETTDTWSDIELEPYKQLIKEDLVDSILVAHVVNKQIDEEHPATLSEKTINGLLRKELGYDGVVISDDLGMGAISKNYEYEHAIELSINAGTDIILHSNVEVYHPENAQITINTILKLVKDGKVSEDRIKEAFSRVWKLKQTIDA